LTQKQTNVFGETGLFWFIKNTYTDTKVKARQKTSLKTVQNTTENNIKHRHKKHKTNNKNTTTNELDIHYYLSLTILLNILSVKYVTVVLVMFSLKNSKNIYKYIIAAEDR